MYRFYTNSPLAIDTKIEFDLDELHHIKHVMRVKNGEKIEVVNGKGALATAYYDSETTFIKTVHIEKKPEIKSLLIQALPEKNHLEFILEKGTEIGITEFWFFPAEKSKIKVITDALLSRMKKITISSLKQCKRLYLPQIYAYHHISDLQETSHELYLADPNGEPFIPRSSKSTGFIVGPEPGFTKDEIHYFQSSCKAKPTSLSPNILRAETAAVIASYLICI